MQRANDKMFEDRSSGNAVAPMSNLILFGAGGHCKVIIDAIERCHDREIRGILDDDESRWDTEHYEYRIIGGRDSPLSPDCEVVIAIGDNSKRRQIADLFRARGAKLGVVVHPSAYIARGVRLGPGTVVFSNAVVSSDAIVGSNTIVDIGAVVAHDCRVGDDVHICPGVQLCGGVTVESGVMIGAGAVVIPGVRVGRNSRVGAGSSVIRNVESDSTVVGLPARPFSVGRKFS
jgi:sugar O-acyltransferase (sialic acid O-acetyltransferase NeuD family)